MDTVSGAPAGPRDFVPLHGDVIAGKVPAVLRAAAGRICCRSGSAK